MKTFIHINLFWMVFSAVAAASAVDDPLTLDSAVEMAIAAAPQLQSQRATIEGAQAALIGAGRLPDPALVAGVENLPSNGVDAWSLQSDFMTMRKIGLMQNFPSRRKRQAEQEAARAVVAVAESEASQSQLELTQTVAQAWVSRYAAAAAAQSLERLKPDLVLQVELSRAAVASGRASSIDVLTTEAAVAELDDRMLDVRRESAAAQAELARWIGAEAYRPLAPPPSLIELPASVAQMLSSVHHHAALLAYDARIAAARSEVAVASAARRPDWSAELDYGLRGPGYSDMVSLQFQVALPLFPGTRQDPAIRAKRAAVRQLAAEREAELRMHTAEITTMLAEWQSAKDRMELYERERLPLARQRSELALAGLRAGRLEARQALAVLSEQAEIEQSYAGLLKSLGRAWAYLRYLPAQGERQ